MSIWIPKAEAYYNEFVPQDIVHALGREYTDFSVPSAVRYQDPFPGNETNADVWSDTLYVMPRLQNYAGPLSEYYANIVAQQESAKP